jgi:hypothetical protein
VLRAAGETETMQENIQDWLELDEKDTGFQLLTGRNCCSDIFLFIFISTTYIIKFPIYLFSDFFLSFRAIFCFINLANRLIQMASPQLIPISGGLL